MREVCAEWRSFGIVGQGNLIPEPDGGRFIILLSSDEDIT